LAETFPSRRRIGRVDKCHAQDKLPRLGSAAHGHVGGRHATVRRLSQPFVAPDFRHPQGLPAVTARFPVRDVEPIEARVARIEPLQ